MPETDLATELAGRKVECPYLAPNQGKCRDDSIGFICSNCSGTGKVYLFDASVRVLCQHPLHGDGHNNALCPGWTASTDLAVWEQAIFQVWLDAHLELRHGVTYFFPSCVLRGTEPDDGFIDTGEPLPALLSCVKQVLEKEAKDG